MEQHKKYFGNVPRALLVVLAALLMAPIGSTVASAAPAKKDPVGQSESTKKVNNWLKPAKKGVVLRSTPDPYKSILAAGSYTRNDIQAPTSMFTYPGGPFCGASIPANQMVGVDGPVPAPAAYSQECGPEQPDIWGAPAGTDAYQLAQYGYVRKHTGKFTAGVFYAHDANALDRRCWYNEETGICQEPEGGRFDGDNRNGPGDHGGQGCHSENGTEPQVTAVSPDGVSLVEGMNCQCNTGLSGNNWKDWIDHWLTYSDPPGDGYQPQFDYFRGNQREIPFNEDGGEVGKIQQVFVDFSICWMPKVDDMIAMQNSLWQMRSEWWNGLFPRQPAGEQDTTNVSGQKYYWGWNEVPVDQRADMTKNHHAKVIKLPAGVTKINDLSKTAKQVLLDSLQYAATVSDSNPKSKALVLNSKKKSKVIVLTEKYKGNDVWKRKAVCQDYTFNKQKKKQLYIDFQPKSKKNDGYCYLRGNFKG